MGAVEIALFLVALTVVVLAGTAIAHRLNVPAPLLLVVVGVVASYVPGVPEVHLEAEVVLLGLLPPLLYAAALQTSLVDFNANRRPILLLSVGLVVFTTVGVAVVARLLVPDLSWPLALALGAVVAPPDAVAATAIGRRIGLPRRVVTILEGESLFNDATALVALRTALAAALGGVGVLEIGAEFLLAAVGGAAIGFAVFLVVAKVRRRVHDPLLDTGISLVVPFASYLLAEEVHASGVISVVVAGLLLGHKAPILQTAQSRIAERMNWRTIAFVLENTVFLLIGLQASWIVAGVADSELPASRVVLVCAATLVAVVVLRLVWVFTTSQLLTRPSSERPPAAISLLVGWAGMRGVVTLAAAFVIPEESDYREVLLLAAFTVVAGTLFGQGLTLPWLARRLDVPTPDPAEDALARASLLHEAAKAGERVLAAAEGEDPHGVVESIRVRVEQRNNAAWERLGPNLEEETPSEQYTRLRRAMIDAERSRVLEIRSEGRVASDVVAEVLVMLDVEESMLDAARQSREELRTARTGERSQLVTECEDLERSPVVETTPGDGCETCLVDGTQWVHLRQCLECGYVGCCDSSPQRHASAHFHDAAHPVMQSAEPGEEWRWCFVHHLTA
jgi:Na+/H+ antiporter